MFARTPLPPALAAERLRAEARIVTMAGVILLAIGLPLALILAALALGPRGDALAPVIWAGPLILMGWGACQYGARRLEQAQALERPADPAP